MEAAVLGTLEYDKIRDMLAARTGSQLGRELAEALLPANDPEVVRQRLDETEEAVRLLTTEAAVPVSGGRDIRAQLKRVSIGGILEPFEIQMVGSVLYASRRIRTGAGEAGKYPAVGGIPKIFSGNAGDNPGGPVCNSGQAGIPSAISRNYS